MNYDDLCKSIGIDRDAISNACADPVRGSICKEPTYLTLRRGSTIKRPITEDLDRFISKAARKNADRLNKK